MKRSLKLHLFSVVCLFFVHGLSWSMTYEDYLREKTLIRIREDAEIIGGSSGRTRDEIRRDSDQQVRERYDQFLTDAILNGIVVFGTPMLNAASTVSKVDNGVGALLQFQLFDGSSRFLTGLAGLIGAGVARVDYTVNLDPALVDANGVALYNTVIGSSTDINSFFALPYTPSGFEDDILATPYDARGNPILFASPGGNVATGTVVNLFSVPEPPIALLAIGALAWLVRSRARR